MPAYIPPTGQTPCNPCNPTDDLELITSSCWRAITDNVGFWSIGDLLTRDGILIADPESGQVNPSVSWFYWNNQSTGATVGAVTFDGSSSMGVLPVSADLVTCEDWRDAPRDARSFIFDVTASPWTPAALPAPSKPRSLSMAILSGTADVTDANANTVTGIPSGFTATWDAWEMPAAITPGVASRVIVTVVA